MLDHLAVHHECARDVVGVALATAVMLLNLETIVVAGEPASAGEALFEPMRRAVARNTMSSHTGPLRIVPRSLGDSTGVRGAAALVLERLPEALTLGSDCVSSS